MTNVPPNPEEPTVAQPGVPGAYDPTIAQSVVPPTPPGGPGGPGVPGGPGGSSGNDDGKSKRGLIIALVVLAAVVAVLVIVLLFTVFAGNEESSTTTTTSSSTTTSSTTTTTTAATTTTAPPTTATTAIAKPAFTALSIPGSVTCPGTGFIDVSWSATNATQVTISIDGPGIYASYPASGSTSVPFACPATQHTYIFRAIGPGGTTETTKVVSGS